MHLWDRPMSPSQVATVALERLRLAEWPVKPINVFQEPYYNTNLNHQKQTIGCKIPGCFLQLWNS